MYTLKRSHIDLIEADVENARITISNLSHELVDHICCEVENLMEHGKTFEEAYALLKEQTGIQVLQKIQENTLYLTDKNYALMKTTMKVTGNLSLALLGVGTVFKIMHWPAAGIMLTLGFALLCFVFFPAAIYLMDREGKTPGSPLLKITLLAGGILFMAGVLFKVQHWPESSLLLQAGWGLIVLLFLPMFLFARLKKAASSKEKKILILGAIAFFIFSLSALLKIFHWPGAGPCLIVGSIMLIGFFLPMYTRNKIQKGIISSAQFLYLVTLSMFAVVLTALISLNVSGRVLKNFEKQDADANKIVQYFEGKKRNMPDSLAGQSAENLNDVAESADKIHSLIQKIKVELVQATEKTEKANAELMVSNSSLIKGKDNNEGGRVLLGEEGSGKELRFALESFREKASYAVQPDPELAVNISRLLNTETYSPEGITWEEMSFRNSMLIGTLSLLSDIDRNVSIAESQVINHLINTKL